MRHASFFSGVGGLDLGFERAGIETVSVSEIDPYACAVLAERFPDAPNLGDIVKLAEKELGGFNGKVEIAGRLQPDDGRHSAVNQISQVGRRSHWDGLSDWRTADIWSGGFPCQDLSVAGKRAGFAGKRSSLAFTFLDLVERRRPRWLVLENVPGLFSSNQGRDFGRLLSEMDDLGYSIAWRTLDARYFGVAQRRRRVFIVACLEPNRAEQVLFECEGGCGHLAPSKQERQGAASGTPDGSGVIGTVIAGLAHGTGTTQDQLYVGYGERVAPALTRRFSKGVNSTIDEPLIISQETDSDRVRAADGLARRMDNQQIFRKSARAQTNEDSETWVEGDVANTLNSFDVGDVRTTHAIIGTSYDGFNQKVEPDGAHRTLRIGRDSSDFVVAPGGVDDDALLPIGLDSHRYRCCGNGVVAPVAEWIGRRIVAVDMVR